jgi:hypothetical protein
MDYGGTTYFPEERDIEEKPVADNLKEKKQKPAEKKESPRPTKLIPLFVLVILVVLVISIYYFINPICGFRKIGSKYPADDGCNVCLCSVKGPICTQNSCEDLGGNYIINEFAELCNWQPGDCDTSCVFPEGRYFFDETTGKCELWEIGSCCTDPPFTIQEECILICED